MISQFIVTREKKDQVINILFKIINEGQFLTKKNLIHSKKQPKNLPAGDIASLRQENETLKNR